MKGKLSLIVAFALLAGSAFAAGSQANVAFSFVCTGKNTGPCPNGGNPNSLIQASDGNFYGTTANSGGKQGGQTIFGGTVFSLTTAGKFTLLHTFAPGTNGKFVNGATPISLTEGPDGKLYGVTQEGGINFGPHFTGYGVVFRVSKNGSGFRVIHRFCTDGPYCTDGASISGPLGVGSDGNVYGVTFQGGNGNGCTGGGCGAIFRVTPSSGAYEVVLSFSSADGGGFPLGMTPASDGTFYGFTSSGTALFHFMPDTGTLLTTKTSFPLPKGCPGLGCFATTAFTFGANGNLYGLYAVYNQPGAAGLFDVQPDGSNLQLFPAFTTTTAGGLELLLATDGNLWAPRAVGSNPDGDIVTLSTDGKAIQTLTPFGSSVFGPAEIIQAKDGTLWGVASGGTATGSNHAAGAVFNLNAGLPPR